MGSFPDLQVVTETMVTLGMSAHTDRMLRLMVDSGVTNTAVLERVFAARGWVKGGLQQTRGYTGGLGPTFPKPGKAWKGKQRGLTMERCMELNLPWVLIESAQKRWTSEKMNLGPLGHERGRTESLGWFGDFFG